MTREAFEELIKEINKAKCSSVHHVEDEVEGFYENAAEVAGQMDVDKHRWYEITTSVYQVGDWYLGLRGPSDLFSEEMDWESCGEPVEAFEMKEVQTITYERKVKC